MLIRGLVELWRAVGDVRYLDAAKRATARIERSHGRGAAYAHEESQRGDARFLSDQVEMAGALIALADATGDQAYRTRAYATLDFARSALGDTAHGGFFALTASERGVGVFSGQHKPLHGNARIARLLLARARREGDAALKELAERTLRSQATAIGEAGRKAGEALLALSETFGGYVMFSVVGAKADPRTKALRDAAYHAYAPHALLREDEPGQGHYPYPGEPAIYLCSDSACSAPVFSAEAVQGSVNAFVRAAREP
jgi:uncharacterized protein YyaL (SSP411 family)